MICHRLCTVIISIRGSWQRERCPVDNSRNLTSSLWNRLLTHRLSYSKTPYRIHLIYYKYAEAKQYTDLKKNKTIDEDSGNTDRSSYNFKRTKLNKKCLRIFLYLLVHTCWLQWIVQSTAKTPLKLNLICIYALYKCCMLYYYYYYYFSSSMHLRSVIADCPSELKCHGVDASRKRKGPTMCIASICTVLQSSRVGICYS